MIVTKEQQQKLVSDYIKSYPINLEIMAFIDGINATLELVDKLMKEDELTTPDDRQSFYCHQQSPMKHNRCFNKCENCASKQ